MTKLTHYCIVRKRSVGRVFRIGGDIVYHCTQTHVHMYKVFLMGLVALELAGPQSPTRTHPNSPPSRTTHPKVALFYLRPRFPSVHLSSLQARPLGVLFHICCLLFLFLFFARDFITLITLCILADYRHKSHSKKPLRALFHHKNHSKHLFIAVCLHYAMF